jgi:DNA-binding transcriptional LysR family regulator
MDTLDAMRAFVRIVERRSFIQAAHDLALPRSRLSEAVQQLERRLGVRLLDRTTRQVAPTTEGEDYYQRCLLILAQIAEADSVGGATAPAGPLRIDVHGTWARHFLLPGVPAFLARYPGVALHIGEGDRLVDLIKEGCDCVIRIGQPADSELIGRRIGALEEGTFASPDYLARCGIPQEPADLVSHQMIGFISSATGAPMPLQFSTPAGIESVTLPYSVTVTAAASYVCLAVHGMGLLQVPRYGVAAELRTGALVEVLPAFAPPPLPVYLLYPQGRQRAPRVKVFMEWAEAQFQASGQLAPSGQPFEATT